MWHHGLVTCHRSPWTHPWFQLDHYPLAISFGSSKKNSLCTQIHEGQGGQLISWYQII
jgi:hypothetical protein